MRDVIRIGGILEDAVRYLIHDAMVLPDTLLEVESEWIVHESLAAPTPPRVHGEARESRAVV